eukprot:364929-Amphidinium_carterae.1
MTNWSNEPFLGIGKKANARSKVARKLYVDVMSWGICLLQGLSSWWLRSARLVHTWAVRRATLNQRVSAGASWCQVAACASQHGTQPA